MPPTLGPGLVLLPQGVLRRSLAVATWRATRRATSNIPLNIPQVAPTLRATWGVTWRATWIFTTKSTCEEFLEWSMNYLWTIVFPHSLHNNDLWTYLCTALWTIYERSMNYLWTIYERSCFPIFTQHRSMSISMHSSMNDLWTKHKRTKTHVFRNCLNHTQSMNKLWTIYERLMNDLWTMYERCIERPKTPFLCETVLNTAI